MGRKGFTLTELLVTISIVSMLAAILVTSLAKAQQKSRSIVCLNNLRQMCMAAELYTDENDGYYPVAQYYRQTDKGRMRCCWDFTEIEDGNSVEVAAGLLWGGQMVEQIQQCPSFLGESNTQSDPYTGYNYNTSYIGHGEGECISIPARAVQVKRPVRCALFGDGQWRDGANKFMRAPLRSEGDRTFNGRYAGTQGYRHGGWTNVGWCDGHASGQNELYTTIEPSRYEAFIAPGTGFLSPDNSAYDLD